MFRGIKMLAHAQRIKLQRACLFLFLIVFLGLPTAFAAEFSLIVESDAHRAFIQPPRDEEKGFFRSAARWRRVDLLKQLSLPDGIAKGDKLVLNLFPDAAYEATIDRVSTNVQGTVTVRGRLRNHPFGHVLISTTGDRSLASISVPELDVEYTIVYDPDSRMHYLSENDPAKMDKLEESPAVMPPLPPPEEQREVGALQERMLLNQVFDDIAATIDVMVVYTPAARTWAIANEGGIGNTIAQAMAKGQLVADNSGTMLDLNLVHSAEVAYTESGNSSTDLDRLSTSGDGYLDAVHALRDAHGADVVVLLENIDDYPETQSMENASEPPAAVPQ